MKRYILAFALLLGGLSTFVGQCKAANFILTSAVQQGSNLALGRVTNFRGVARTPNQLQVANSLDVICQQGPRQTETSMLNVLRNLPTNDQVSLTLDQLSGEVYAGVGSLFVEQDHFFLRLAADQLRSLRSPSSTAEFNGIVRGNIEPGDEYSVLASDCACCDDGHWGHWHGYLQAYGLGGDFEGDINAQMLEYSSAGLLFGANSWWDESTVVGFTGGFVHSEIDRTANIFFGDTDVFQFALHARRSWNSLYGLAILGYANGDAYVQRRITALQLIPKGEVNTNHFLGYGEVGTEWSMSGWTLQPFVGLQYIHVNQDAFTETQGTIFNLALANETIDSGRFSIGARFSGNMCVGGWNLSPWIQGRFVHEFGNTNRSFTGAFLTNLLTPLTIQGATIDEEFFLFSTGVTAHCSDWLSVFVGYHGQIADQHDAHAGSGGVQVQW